MHLLDVSRLIWRRWAGRIPTGIDRVCLAYLRRFGSQSLAVIQRKGWRRVLDRHASERLFALLAAPCADFRRRLVAQTLTWPAHGASRYDIRGRIYLNPGHTGLDEPSLVDWIRQNRLRAVYFIHDLIPITHPEYCREGEAERHRRRMDTVLGSAAGVIGNSRQTIDDFNRWANARGRAAPPAIAALLGVDLPDEGPKANGSSTIERRPKFLVVGTIEGRKNHLLLLQVWARLASQLGDRTPQLNIVGQRGWESEQAADFLDRSELLRGHVREFSRCTDTELTTLLAEARALLFPSFVEGYGLPLAEAMGHGTPVIASDLPVFREIGGDIPLYLDPLDGPAWIAAIIDYARRDSAGRRAQTERPKRYRMPTWEDHFAAVEPWLDSL